MYIRRITFLFRPIVGLLKVAFSLINYLYKVVLLSQTPGDNSNLHNSGNEEDQDNFIGKNEEDLDNLFGDYDSDADKNYVPESEVSSESFYSNVKHRPVRKMRHNF